MNSLIKSVQKKYPDWRIGQIISNAAAESGWPDTDIFYIPDSQLEVGLKRMLESKTAE